MKQIFSIIVFIFLANFMFAQSRSVNGKLTAFFTYPVQNIELLTKESKSIIASDSLGQFSIICNPHDIIKIKPKGFHPVTRKVESDTDSLLINLVFINSKKNREIVIANGNISESDLLYAVEHLEHVNNDFSQFTDIFTLVKDQFPNKFVITGEKIYVKRQQIEYSDEEYEALSFPQAQCRVNGMMIRNIAHVKPSNIKSISLSNCANTTSDGTGKEIVILTRESDSQ